MELFVGIFSHSSTDIDFGTTSSLTASFRKIERDRNYLLRSKRISYEQMMDKQTPSPFEYIIEFSRITNESIKSQDYKIRRSRNRGIAPASHHEI
jgi:hypothetical protein